MFTPGFSNRMAGPNAVSAVNGLNDLRYLNFPPRFFFRYRNSPSGDWIYISDQFAENIVGLVANGGPQSFEYQIGCAPCLYHKFEIHEITSPSPYPSSGSSSPTLLIPPRSQNYSRSVAVSPGYPFSAGSRTVASRINGGQVYNKISPAVRALTTISGNSSTFRLSLSYDSPLRLETFGGYRGSNYEDVRFNSDYWVRALSFGQPFPFSESEFTQVSLGSFNQPRVPATFNIGDTMSPAPYSVAAFNSGIVYGRQLVSAKLTNYTVTPSNTTFYTFLTPFNAAGQSFPNSPSFLGNVVGAASPTLQWDAWTPISNSSLWNSFSSTFPWPMYPSAASRSVITEVFDASKFTGSESSIDMSTWPTTPIRTLSTIYQQSKAIYVIPLWNSASTTLVLPA